MARATGVRKNAGGDKSKAKKTAPKVENVDLGGRPRKEIDLGELAKACEIQCTAEECAHLFDCSTDTLDRRLKESGYDGFAEFYKKHSNSGKSSLRRFQWKSAEEGNVTMQIWLGKQMLDQRDKHDVELNVSDDIAEMLDARRKRAKAAKSG